MMRRWNHTVILVRGISRFLSAVCRRWLPGQSGDRTCLVLYERLVICLTRPFQLLPLVAKFFPPPPRTPTCHCLHILMVLSSLICRKCLLICGGFFAPIFPGEILISYFEILAWVISSANQCTTIWSSRSFS